MLLGRVFASRRAWLVGSGTAVFFAAAWWWHHDQARADDTAVRALIVAAEGRAPDGVRLTGGFWNSSGRESQRQSPEFRLAAARLEQLADTEQSAAALHGLAVARLLAGRLDDAVQAFQLAGTRALDDATLLSDWSAAYLTRGRARADPADLVLALSLSLHAVRVGPELLEPRFNAAAAADALGLPGTEQRWKDYTSRETQPLWLDEARRRMQQRGVAIRAPLETDLAAIAAVPTDLSAWVGIEPDRMRKFIQHRSLPEWARATENGHQVEAASALRSAARIADALATATGDRFFQDAVRATGRAHEAAARSLATALLTYETATQRYDEDKTSEAARLFDQAEASLSRVQHPLAFWSRYYQAIEMFYEGRLDDVLRQLDGLELSVRGRRYGALQSRIDHLRGLTYQTAGRPAEAADATDEALTLAQAAREVETQMAAATQMAGILEMLGDERRAWTFRARSFELLPRVDNPRRRHVALVGAGRACLAQNMPEAAIEFENQAFENARTWAQAGAFVEAFSYRARAFVALTRPTEAQADVQSARDWLRRVPDQRIVARFEAELFATETQASLATAPAKAVEAATLSIARLKAAGGAFRLAEAWLTRGRAWIRSGLPVKAEADFLQGIEAFEAERTTVPSRQARMIAFPEARNLFSELIKLYVAQGLPDKAFAVAERGRARSLLDAIAPTATRLSRMEVGQRLRPNEVMAYYVVTDDQLFVWGLSRRSHRFARIPTDIATLRTLVAALRDQIDRGEETSAVTTAGQLYDLLLSPVEDLLKPDDRLVVVADDAIHDVPFSVLWSRQRRRFLVEDHAVVSTPSATIFFGGNGSQAAAPAPKSALIISVPEDLSKAANLPALRHADAEARDIAKLYGPQLVLEGASATKARFIDAVGKYDVIHFVGHAIANPTYPGLSRFVVAPDPAGTGTALYAYELEAIRRGMTSIVVLAACETAAGRTVRGEGVSSLARPFVAAGISTVVATMWNLPDRPAGRLFPAFHLALRRAAAADALRSVQLAMLRSDDSAMRSLSAWAGVVIIAGTPPG